MAEREKDSILDMLSEDGYRPSNVVYQEAEKILKALQTAYDWNELQSGICQPEGACSHSHCRARRSALKEITEALGIKS